ncbi:CLUMA_CG021081, isoform A [Clunio marinus]|uniref:CLUMA_CG021081, isoform A n=1 Tax=Clunio marinus TaxID=568069 RepID=A0A1J1JAW9_9DIPT|nr:CLUMA_CG021081, isoform A [Clunio marinus]
MSDDKICKRVSRSFISTLCFFCSISVPTRCWLTEDHCITSFTSNGATYVVDKTNAMIRDHLDSPYTSSTVSIILRHDNLKVFEAVYKTEINF